MAKYLVSKGAIASVQVVKKEDGTVIQAVYLGPERILPDDKTVHPVEFDQDVPIEVKAVVNRNFAARFCVPVERRQGIIDSSLDTEIVIEEDTPAR